MSNIRYFVFDIESRADGDLVSKLRYPGENLPGDEAIQRFRQWLIENRGTDFIPYTYQVPCSVAVGKVRGDFRLEDVALLDKPQYRPHVITDLFWRGWEHYGQPTLVTFNGRSFDLPLLELAAFRYGISVPSWFRASGPSYEQARYRYNQESHLDLQDVLTNYGASRFSGGLNLAANVLGKPGKMDVQGDMVQDMFFAGKLEEINDYCRCDVLDTYFVFLRCQVIVGRLSLEDEQQIVEETKAWIRDRAATDNAYRLYLERWGDWHDPFPGRAAESQLPLVRHMEHELKADPPGEEPEEHRPFQDIDREF